MHKDGPTTSELDLTGLKFVAASHRFIRYIGRWNPTPDSTRWDASFPGAYFDIKVNSTTTVLISLRNSRPSSGDTDALPDFLRPTNTSAAPISLLARVDENDYSIFPNATSLVAIQSLDAQSSHDIRIIAPMASGNDIETLQFQGVWIDDSGEILPSEAKQPRKLLEIITDAPGSSVKHLSTATRGILGGVTGWEYLLGEMFGADHTAIVMKDMCLVQDCVGGRGSPIGMADVFFQSGPLGTEHFAKPWLFQAYEPNIMIMNLGTSDRESFQMHKDDYRNKTSWELEMIFEDTYVSMIKAIRTLSYPNTPDLPIFVMRPLRGQLERATLAVVDRIRIEGDSSIYWLDTSGWLDTSIDFEGQAAEQDFYMSPSKQWRLTERGNQRVAILLHLHVCRYLAQDADKCAFLPPETYHGQVDRDGRYFEDDDGGVVDVGANGGVGML